MKMKYRRKRYTRRKKRSYRKKTYRRPVRKMKMVSRRKRLLGYYKKGPKVEKKYLVYTKGTSGNLSPATGYLIWSTDTGQQDTSNTYFNPNPAQGIGLNQISGVQFRYIGIDLRFSVFYIANSSTTSLPHDELRLYIVRNKELGVSKSDVLTSFNQPIETKDFDIIYDRVFSYSCGLVTTSDAQANSLLSKPLNFRFWIPFKTTQTLLATGYKYNILQNYFVYLFPHYNAYFTVQDVYAKIYFTDL